MLVEDIQRRKNSKSIKAWKFLISLSSHKAKVKRKWILQLSAQVHNEIFLYIYTFLILLKNEFYNPKPTKLFNDSRELFIFQLLQLSQNFRKHPFNFHFYLLMKIPSSFLCNVEFVPKQTSNKFFLGFHIQLLNYIYLV